MFHIECEGHVVGDYEQAYFIRKNQSNGCYVPCSQDEAEGICVKVPRKAVATVFDESGNATEGQETIVTSYEDKVFRITGDGLNGDEPIATVTEVDGFTSVTEQKAAAYDIMVGVTE